MPTTSLWRTATFRLSLALAGVFVIGGLALLTAFLVAVQNYAETSTRQSLRAEMAGMEAALARRGPLGLGKRMTAIVQAGGERRFYFLVSNASVNVHVGDLPAEAGAKLGFGRILLQRPEGAPVEVMTLARRSQRGTLIVIGRDLQAVKALSDWMVKLTLWGGAGLILVGLAAGLAAAALVSRNLEKVNAAATRIMDGRLEERLPSIGLGDEFDRLSRNLNLMLDRVQDAMTALRQVSADVAHDLRTPLTRLRNALEQASLEEPPGSRRNGPLASALADTDEILQVFDALVRIAQIEGGSARQHFGRTDLSTVMEHVVDAYQPEAEDSQHELSADITPDVTVRGDGALLRQLLANLIENALLHTPAGARIFVSLTRMDGHALLRVADDGPGVPEAEYEKISRRFYRLDRSRSTPGAGLGLALVSAVVEAHGGVLSFRDNQPGLLVEIRLPVSDAD